MVWLPTVSELLIKVAVVPLSGTTKKLPLSTTNLTCPVGVPAPGAVTLMVAMKVTSWPTTDGLGEDVSAVLVPALLTICVVVGRMEVGMVAVLVPLTVGVSIAVPSVNVPLVNVTIPVGLEPLPLTMAVKVTACPDTDGLGADATVVVLLL